MSPKENHGLGDEILKGVIRKAAEIERSRSAVPTETLLPKYTFDFRVYREQNDIDILAVSNDSDKYVLVIENKVWAKEHGSQLEKYRRIVECKFPGWKHSFVLLSPTGFDAERDDPELWCPMRYDDMLEIIEDALIPSAIDTKVKDFIEDYIETIRRHIVGDEKLQDTCFEIYSKHREAFDLMYENVSGAAKRRFLGIALEWAQQHDDVIVSEQALDNAGQVCFTTSALEKLPSSPSPKSGHGQVLQWGYEICVYYKSGIANLKACVQLACRNGSRCAFDSDSADVIDPVLEEFGSQEGEIYTKDPAYRSWWTKQYEDFTLDEQTNESIFAWLDDTWKDFRRRESIMLGSISNNS